MRRVATSSSETATGSSEITKSDSSETIACGSHLHMCMHNAAVSTRTECTADCYNGEGESQTQTSFAASNSTSDHMHKAACMLLKMYAHVFTGGLATVHPHEFESRM